MTTQAIKSTTERMTELLRRWETDRDDRRIFLDCYSRMTRNMIQAIDDGRFEDSVWVSGLLRHFADYYFRALDTYERGEPATPAVWRQAFVATTVPRTTAIQHLLLGVNAHINFDLVFAIGDVLEPQCLGESGGLLEVRYRDHRLVNTIIGETVDEVQDEVIERHSPTLDLLDKLGGPFDERLTSWLIAGWREEVWEAATHLLTCASEAEAARLKTRIETRALERARLLLLF